MTLNCTPKRNESVMLITHRSASEILAQRPRTDREGDRHQTFMAPSLAAYSGSADLKLFWVLIIGTTVPFDKEITPSLSFICPGGEEWVLESRPASQFPQAAWANATFGCRLIVKFGDRLRQMVTERAPNPIHKMRGFVRLR